MTRDDDSKVGLDDRWKMRQNKKVDAVINIHFNSGNSTATGTETIDAATRTQDKGFAEALISNETAMENLGTTLKAAARDFARGVRAGLREYFQ
nr:N-acetylmuramoyl-L-alanine amidase [uncultured Brevibacillus sp.]